MYFPVFRLSRQIPAVGSRNIDPPIFGALGMAYSAGIIHAVWLLAQGYPSPGEDWPQPWPCNLRRHRTPYGRTAYST